MILNDFYKIIKNTEFEQIFELQKNIALKKLEDSYDSRNSERIGIINSISNLIVDKMQLDMSNGVVKFKGNEIKSDILKNYLKKFHPWRKGPFDINGIFIDSEWRSDKKWNRLKKTNIDFTEKKVLDIGCGNGYYLFRACLEGYSFLVGLEPYLNNLFQFYALKSLVKNIPVYVLPHIFEELSVVKPVFDIVFYMGVLYHTKNPFLHLEKIRNYLKDEGTAIIETIILHNAKNITLTPTTRYAKMRNVWFVPSLDVLLYWIKKAGFSNTEIVDITKTDFTEQRKTEWMQFESLEDFLDPDDLTKTIEKYPAPVRAMVIASK